MLLLQYCCTELLLIPWIHILLLIKDQHKNNQVAKRHRIDDWFKNTDRFNKTF